MIRSVIKIEYFAGDCMKIIGEMCHQLCERDKLQNAEIMALIECLLGELNIKPSNKKRPVADREFLKNYHSGNELTRSEVMMEKSASMRLGVIKAVAQQLITYDGLTKSQVLALCRSYLNEHIIEYDI